MPRNDPGFTPDDRDLLIRLAERMTVMSAEVTTLRKKIEGNGQPGLLTRMARVETRVLILWALVLTSLGLSGTTLLP